MTEKKPSILMLSGDTDFLAGKKGPFYSVLAALSPHFYRIDVICTSAKKARMYQEFGNVQAISFGRSPLGFLKTIIFLIKHTKTGPNPPDLIISHDFGLFRNGILAFILAICFKKFVVSEILHVDGHPLATSYQEYLLKIITTIYIFLAKFWVKGFRIINNIEMRNFLISRGVPENKIILSYAFFIDRNEFFPIKNVPKKWDLIFCGRLASNKGLEIIFKALSILKNRGRPQKLIIRGTGPLEKKLHSLAYKLQIHDLITFKGWVKDSEELANLYRSSKILVCASTCEGGPRVNLEAMACGVPVISTPVGIMSEIGRDGENCLLFKWDPEELANKIEKLQNDHTLRSKLIENGLADSRRFEKNTILSQYAKNYLKLLKETS